MKTVRCAIYTRKSSDEGLEHSFNSLDAQREACAAYILSQASEGWSEVKERYDDGGLSGGTLERPALQRLLADVAAARVDIIVVYKVDRLTRSLLDFAKLVEAFDRADTSFVSVTQSFNTTTSMGRLTLNMLLSFAQFEREVTAERIRDKIAASKAKGMWMGGTPPLGYAPDGRSLKIVDDHAAIVRDIYERYLALGSVRLVQEALSAAGIRLPRRRRHTNDQAIGGGWFSRGQLYKILGNPVYTGVVVHKEQRFPGLHPPIIDQALWDEVQGRMNEQRQGGARRTRAASPSLLAGKIVDAAGEPLIATHATKGTARYRYYVSRALHHGTGDTGLRVPAREIERLVVERTGELFRDPLALIATAWLDLAPDRIAALHEHCARLGETRSNAQLLAGLVTQVRLHDGQVEIACATGAIADALCASRHAHAPAEIVIAVDARLTRSGRVLRLVHEGAPATERTSASLTGLLARARCWWAELRKGEIDIRRLAAREKLTPSYVTRVVRLAFLAPAVTDAILAGRQGADVDVRRLTLDGPLPADWREQRRQLLPAAPA